MTQAGVVGVEAGTPFSPVHTSSKILSWRSGCHAFSGRWSSSFTSALRKRVRAWKVNTGIGGAFYFQSDPERARVMDRVTIGLMHETGIESMDGDWGDAGPGGIVCPNVQHFEPALRALPRLRGNCSRTVNLNKCHCEEATTHVDF